MDVDVDGGRRSGDREPVASARVGGPQPAAVESGGLLQERVAVVVGGVRRVAPGDRRALLDEQSTDVAEVGVDDVAQRPAVLIDVGAVGDQPHRADTDEINEGGRRFLRPALTRLWCVDADQPDGHECRVPGDFKRVAVDHFRDDPWLVRWQRDRRRRR